MDFSGSDCISIRTIRDYTPLDRSTLLIEGAGKRKYLVTLIGPSFELRSSMGIGVASRDGWLCPYGGDTIVVDSLNREHLNIRGISRVNAEQAEDLLIRYGKKVAPTIENPTPAEKVDGAEVEELG